MDVLKCPCGNTLARRAGDLWVIPFKGRMVMAREVLGLHCERCKRDWTATSGWSEAALPAPAGA